MNHTLLFFQYAVSHPWIGEALVTLFVLFMLSILFRKPKAPSTMFPEPLPYNQREIKSEKLSKLSALNTVTIVHITDEGVPIGQYSSDFAYERFRHKTAPCFFLDELVGAKLKVGETYNVKDLLEIAQALHT